MRNRKLDTGCVADVQTAFLRTTLLPRAEKSYFQPSNKILHRLFFQKPARDIPEFPNTSMQLQSKDDA